MLKQRPVAKPAAIAGRADGPDKSTERSRFRARPFALRASRTKARMAVSASHGGNEADHAIPGAVSRQLGSFVRCKPTPEARGPRSCVGPASPGRLTPFGCASSTGMAALQSRDLGEEEPGRACCLWVELTLLPQGEGGPKGRMRVFESSSFWATKAAALDWRRSPPRAAKSPYPSGFARHLLPKGEGRRRLLLRFSSSVHPLGRRPRPTRSTIGVYGGGFAGSTGCQSPVT
jgi:hypothetical protein